MGNGVRADAAAADTASCDLSADAPHQAMVRTSHGTAAVMRARIAGPSITHSSNKAWRTGGDDFGPAICGEPKMADFAASAGMDNRVNSAPLGVES